MAGISGDWLGDLRRNAFYLIRRYPDTPCDNGNYCYGKPYTDEYGTWHEGCSRCKGMKVYTRRESYWVGHFMRGVVDAMWCERAFQEGHSAGLTDGMR